jgi:hypothetical protein
MQSDSLLAQQANTGQAAATGTPPDTLTMPADPAAILLTASSWNGLHGPNPPVHASQIRMHFSRLAIGSLPGAGRYSCAT